MPASPLTALRNLALTLPVLAAVTWASLTSWFPEFPDLEQIPFIDKWVHFIMYAGLSAAFQIDYLRHCRRHKTATALPVHTLIGLAAPALWGALMELAQAWLTTYRTGDPLDALANAVGALLGFLLGLALTRLLRLKP